MKLKIIALLLGLSGGVMLYHHQVSTRYFYQLMPTKNVQIAGSYPASAQLCQQAECYRFKYDLWGRPVRVEFLSQLRPGTDRVVGVFAITQRYKDKGFERRFYDENNNPTADFDGVYGEDLMSVAESANYLKMHVDQMGEPIQNTRGVYGYLEAISNGFKISSTPLDQNQQPMVDVNGVAQKTFVRNLQGFVLETRNYDVSDNLVNSLKDGAAVTKKTVNQYGDVTRIEYFDTDLNRVGTILEWSYDQQGNEIDE